MHPDREFDGDANRLPNEASLARDLELNILFEAMSRGDTFLYGVAEQAVLSSLQSPDEIRYRQEVLADCLKHPDVVRRIYQIPVLAIESRQAHWMGVFGRYPSSILSGGRQLLALYVELLADHKQIADDQGGRFGSWGFRRFFSMIQEELSDDYLDTVRGHVGTLAFRNGVLLSGELGRANQGVNYVLRKADDGSWIRRIREWRSPAYSYTLHPRDDAGARILGALKDTGINAVANAVAQSADHIEGFLNALRQELAFYVGCLNLAERLGQLGDPFTFPEPAPVGAGRHSVRGLYDPALSLTMKRTVVANDLNADTKGLVFITGANQGGKSTLLRAIGIAQLMMQCGMFVPARSFSADICRGLFTHYKREEDATMESGKLDEELNRMSEIVDAIAPEAMVLFNESFAATNEREGSEIARQITSALLESHVKMFFVTHLYDLANGFYAAGLENVAYLRAERRPDGERTFRFKEGGPLDTSFGRDVYNEVFGRGKGDSDGERSGPPGAAAGRPEHEPQSSRGPATPRRGHETEVEDTPEQASE
jgi:hypothetical protein